MKIHRIALQNYRGIAEREIHFAPSGVTIVEGPNEVGKSSLAEAFELILEERDDTAKQRVRDVRPVHRDAGAEVKVELELGPHRFVYAKRFHKKPTTTLRELGPRGQRLTGREAHECVRRWLDRHVDVSLWRALRIVQGAPLAQPALGEAQSLSAALDRAAGVGSDGEREQSLFDRAQAEFELHYTPTGRPRKPLTAAEKAAAVCAEEARVLGERLEGLERDVAREATLRARVAELESGIASGRVVLREAEARLEEIQTLREAALRLDARLAAAHAAEAEAVQAARQRNQLVSFHAAAEANLESLAEALESEEPALIAAGAELRHAEERLVSARDARAAADAAVKRARGDAALRRGERELAELRERSERVAHERAELARARDVLNGPTIDASTVEAIQTAELAVERSAARLAAEGPAVEIRPEVDLEIVVDGRRVRVPAGVAVEQRIAESWLLSLPGFGEVRVVAGVGVTEQRKILEQARTELRTLCMEAGVEGHAGAVAALSARRAAADEIARSEQRLSRALGDASPASLREEVSRLETRLRREMDARSAEPPIPASLEEAERELERCEAEAQRVRQQTEEATRRREEAALRQQQTEMRLDDTHKRLEMADQSRVDFARRLADARTTLPDEELEEKRDACRDAVRALEAEVREAAVRLAERRPEETEAATRDARDALDTRERELREQREARVAISARLEEAGKEGLYERWEEAKRAMSRAERDHARLLRRAEAAKRLFEVLREEREAARRHYTAPLAEAIEALGRPLFGDDFAVELDEDLSIARRFLDGRSLAESQLSAGAREQLALLSRLAAARIAGGVPLWLDDALGHSDAARLAALGPLLAAVGEESQVIVLTCSPERFASVPDARVVPLR